MSIREIEKVCWVVKHYESSLYLNDGMVDLKVIQASCERSLVGKEKALQNYALNAGPSKHDIDECKSFLNSTCSDSLTVISYHPGLRGCEDELIKLSYSRVVVGLGGNLGNGTNIAYIAGGGILYKKEKLSLSVEDKLFGLKSGEELAVFDYSNCGLKSVVKWTVLNCHDYTHVDIIKELQKLDLELIIVVTYNTASRLFWEYAISDIHRLFCYVVIVNVAELGGSGVFAPFRQNGKDRNSSLNMGGQMFGAKGPGSFNVNFILDIQELRDLRKYYSENGFNGIGKKGYSRNEYQPILPPEKYLSTIDRVAGEPIVNKIIEYEIDFNFNNPLIAIAQLNSMSIDSYVNSKYRIREDSDSNDFEHLLSVKLFELESRCRAMNNNNKKKILDLLVMPEVFVPRTYIRTLQGFSDRMGAHIICGVDYPDGGEDENVNECYILQPHDEPLIYRKITRSQYDAVKKGGGWMPMKRGEELIRLVSSDRRGIGLLICSDYSHYDLMWKLNMQGRDYPLDMVVVVAHNPSGLLYRSCCIADSHRFYQYIIMCNVMKYGGSGVFAPLRTRGARQVLVDMGQGVEAISVTSINLDALLKARMRQDKDMYSGEFMRKPGALNTRWILKT